jgi:hypothetical protein
LYGDGKREIEKNSMPEFLRRSNCTKIFCFALGEPAAKLHQYFFAMNIITAINHLRGFFKPGFLQQCGPIRYYSSAQNCERPGNSESALGCGS